MGGIYTGGDVVLLMLHLVVFYHQPCRTRGGEVRHDGRADGYRQILDAVVYSHFCLHFLFLSSVSFPGFGRVRPSIPDSKFPIQLEIFNSKFLILNSFFFLQLGKYFSLTGKVIFCAFSNHTTKVRQEQAAIVRFRTLRYDSIRFHMLFGSSGFLAVRPGEAL